MTAWPVQADGGGPEPGSAGGDELIEDVRETGQIGQLARWRRFGPLAEAVDPDRADAELVGGHDVVEMALGDVDVAGPVGAGRLVERAPVPMGGLVRADLGR